MDNPYFSGIVVAFSAISRRSPKVESGESGQSDSRRSVSSVSNGRSGDSRWTAVEVCGAGAGHTQG